MTKDDLIEELKNVPNNAEIYVYDLFGDNISATKVDIDFYGENKEFVDVFIS